MKCRLAILLLALLAAPAVAGGIQGTCDVRFLATATLHDFSGTVRSRPFAAPLSRDAAGKSVLPSVEVEVAVAEMKTGNDSRDEKMREMFQSDRHPVIRAVARDIDADRARERMRKDPGGTAPLEVTLAIRGVERMVQATAGNWKEDGDRVAFDVEFPVSLKEFGLKAPTVLGLIRVGDRVVVKGTFVLTVQGAP
ncbi:MAG TPA: YceI family protein [Candidatus Deferrimicrobiaceae bacterium]